MSRRPMPEPADVTRGLKRRARRRWSAPFCLRSPRRILCRAAGKAILDPRPTSEDSAGTTAIRQPLNDLKRRATASRSARSNRRKRAGRRRRTESARPRRRSCSSAAQDSARPTPRNNRSHREVAAEAEQPCWRPAKAVPKPPPPPTQVPPTTPRGRRRPPVAKVEPLREARSASLARASTTRAPMRSPS